MAQTTWWGFVWFSSVAFCLAAAHAQAGTIRYVNNASPTCQEHAPCYASMQAGIDAAQAGDTVRIQAGTYTEQILIQGKNAHATASEADRIVIEADAGAVPGSVVLHGAVSQCTNGYALRFQQSHYLTIRGLTITGAGMGVGVCTD